jgi:hypothetical protein
MNENQEENIIPKSLNQRFTVQSINALKMSLTGQNL